MVEESMDEFLRKSTAERKPLSDQEKKEAMKVAKKVLKEAVEKIKERDSVVLDLHESDCNTVVHISNPRHKDFKGKSVLLEDPNIDLVIHVLRFPLAEKEYKSDRYDFSTGNVTKVEAHVSQSDQHKSTEDPELDFRNYLKRKEEQTIEERYHPDKHDLQSLLDIVTSAQESPSV